jgi:acetyltransferase
MHPERQTADLILSNAQTAGRTILTEFESKQILAAYGIPTVKTILALTVNDAIIAANEIGFPVVLKINSQTVTHKTDVGGVKLNLNSSNDVQDAFVDIQRAVESKFSKDDFQGVTVQPLVLARDSYELIIGASGDDQFGPVMLFGSGGTLVEVYNDRALALPPLNSNLAQLMMKKTKIYKALKGVRGKSAVDMSALEKLIVNFSHLVMEKWQYISEVEINPLLASGDALLALDARIILHPVATSIIRPAIRPYPSHYEQRFVSKKGRTMMIRPIRPEDEPLVVDFHKLLSEDSVYKR